jgi:MarR family transcriptional regulator, organic hydroperoxide resistance regulator
MAVRSNDRSTIRGEAGLEEFEQSWDEFFSAVRRARGRAAREQPPGLTLAQFHLLSPLHDAGELPVGEIALAAGIATPTATRMLDGLARAGIITREHSKADRRVVKICLTAKGRRLVRAKRELVASKRRSIHDSLSGREREQAVALLKRLAAAIEEL